MRHLTEASLGDLHDSAVRAFPRTTKRQHAVGPVVIEELRWTPFLGMKTLFVRAAARNEDRQYSPMVLFKKVDYAGTGVRLVASDGLLYQFTPLALEGTDTLLRCDCPDFAWRFNYYNHLDGSLYGSKRKKYESRGGPPANPMQLPGMCKHLMKTVSALQEAGLFGG
jgi:hypothetical protein